MKPKYILLPILFLLSCNRYKPFVVKLLPDRLHNESLGKMLQITTSEEPDSNIAIIGKKLGLNNIGMIRMEHSILKFIAQHENKLTDSLDSETLFMIGMKRDSIYVIVDENNNNLLDDDRVIAMPKSLLASQSTKNLERLAIARVNNLKVKYINNEHTFSKHFYLLPDTIRTKDLNLDIISTDVHTGTFLFKKRKYYVQARGMLSLYFDTSLQFTSIIINNKKDTSVQLYKESSILHFGDTLKSNKNVFLIHYVSPFTDQIILKPLHPGKYREWANDNIKRNTTLFSTQQTEDLIGKDYPYLNLLSDSLLAGSCKNKVILLNFWFTQCPPCIAEFNALNNLYKQYKNDSSFKIISITFESAQEVKRMREKYNLLFDIYSVPEEKIYQLNLNNQFPTNIVIGKNGIVSEIFRGGQKDSDAAEDFFKSEVNKKIMEQLKL
jgi:thiol-disulfide isomerase/thioredoxin